MPPDLAGLHKAALKEARREGKVRSMDLLISHFEAMESEDRLVALAQAGLTALLLEWGDVPRDVLVRVMAMWPGGPT